MARTVKLIIDAENRTAKAFQSMDRNLERVNRQLTFGRNALLGFFSAAATLRAVDNVRRMADEYTNLTARLRLVIDDSEELQRVQEDLFGIAQETRNAYRSTAETYERLARSTRNLNLESSLLTSVTRTVNQAITISGSSAQSADAALVQFGQGLAANALRGQELNSVMEQTPRLAQAIADGLGVSLSQLRALAAQGELTAEKIIGAILDQADELDAEFAKIPVTIEQGFVKIRNALLKYIGEADTAAEASRNIAAGLGQIAEHLPAIIQLLSIVATIVGGGLLVALLKWGQRDRGGDSCDQGPRIRLRSVPGEPAHRRGSPGRDSQRNC